MRFGCFGTQRTMIRSILVGFDRKEMKEKKGDCYYSTDECKLGNPHWMPSISTKDANAFGIFSFIGRGRDVMIDI